MGEENSTHEANLARSHIDASRRRIEAGASLGEVHDDGIKTLSDASIGLLILLILVFGALYLFFDLQSLAVEILLLLLSAALIYLLASALIQRKRLRDKRQRDIARHQQSRR